MNTFRIQILAWFIGTLLFFPSCSEAQNDQGDRVVEGGNSLLWKIEGNGLEEPSYLYGTIHLIPKHDFEMGEGLKRTLENSDVLVMELNLEMKAMMSAIQKMMLPANKTIEDYLTPRQYDSLQVFLKDTLEIPGMQLAMAKRMKPFFMAQMFYGKMLGEEPMSFELTFKSMADTLDMEIMGLETIEEQVSMLDSIPMDVQVEMLMESVRSYEKMKDEYQKLVELYKRQSLDSLNYYMNETSEDLMEFESLLLGDRNMKWADKLDGLIGGEQYFIAVGAAHLPGENGVIELLRKRGYDLTPVSTK